MNVIIDFLGEYGYLIAIILGVIWIGLEIVDHIRKKKQKQRIEESAEVEINE